MTNFKEKIMKLICVVYFLLQILFPVYVVVVAWASQSNIDVSIWSTALACLTLIPNLLLLTVAMTNEEHKDEE